ncbi:MAG: hypothetical protein Q9217_001767 [Psora testacea]
MVNAEYLTTQHNELLRCASRREALLRSLFGASNVFLSVSSEPDEDEDPSNAETQERELAAFLDANDITKNRLFDPSTLPSVRRGRRPIESHQHSQRRSPHDHGLAKQDRRAPPGQIGGSEEDSPLRMEPTETALSQSYEEANVRPLYSLPTSDDAVSRDMSAIRAAEAEERPGNAHTLKLPPSSPQERRWEDGQREREEAALNTNGKSDNGLHEDGNDLTSSNLGQNAYMSNKGSSIDNASKSQMKVIRREAYGGTPATPDSQLRFEEAQSIGRSKASANTDGVHAGPAATSAELPSLFIQDPFDDGGGMMDIPTLNDDATSRQQQDGSMPTSGMRNPMPAGVNGDAFKDPTFSRRPPMRIDTDMPSTSHTPSHALGNITVAPASEVITPTKSVPPSSNTQLPPERMTTRVSSGALRHKSVSEILGETPKITPTPPDKGFSDASNDDHNHLQTPKSATTIASPDAVAFKLRLNELKEKEKSKLSTVVFAKQQPSVASRSSDHTQSQHSDGDEKALENRDYFLTYFAAQASTPPRAPPLSALLRSAHKTLSTSDHYTEFREKQDYRILSKIWERQNTGRWSLRQPERALEPQRPVTHWDILLSQMKWMRTDFREERKFKMAGAKFLAEACAAWFACPPKERRSLQVKLRPVHAHATAISASATPDLVHDETSEATEDEMPIAESTPGNAPAAIFSLPPDVFIFGLNKSPVAEKLLLELPCYDPSRDLQNAAVHLKDLEPDAAWKTPLLPVSKYAKAKLVSREEGPPRKKSRLDYLDDSTVNPKLDVEHPAAPLAPAGEDVALFNPNNKHIRDRIHAGHAFRPPSEYQMPTKEFFECRQPSQWTLAEEDELRRLVREYAYNWSLISSCLSPRSIFSSGAERRTPWECFERWIGLEGLPAEMTKVPYFRTYNIRLQQAQKTYEAHQQALIQQHGGNPAQLPLRRRSTQPYTVDRRKNMKHIHIIDAMRRQAKKRETALHKQQHVAGLAAMRKATEPPKPKIQVQSPREMSRLKYEKQMKAEEQAKILRMQYINAQNVKKAAQQQQQAGQHVNGVLPNRNVAPGMPNGSSPNMASTTPHLRGAGLDPARAGPQMQRLLNSHVNGVVPTNGQGISHAPVQPQMQMQMGQRVPPQMASELRMIQEAQRVQAEQQAFLQQRQQQRHPQQNGQGGSPNTQNLNSLSQNSANMLATTQGRSSPSINGAQPPPVTSTSPCANHAQPQSLSSGMTPAVNQIQNQVKLRHPGASPGEISRLTTEQLYRMSQQTSIQQTAMAAAAGNSGGSMGGMQAPNPIQQQAMMSNGQANVFNQQQYAQYMRNQQASQQRRGSVGSNMAGMNGGSRSATPLVQRTGSAQGGGPGRGPSQSPRAGTVGVAGGQ